MSNQFFPVRDQSALGPGGTTRAIPWIVKSRAPRWNTQVQEGMGGSQFRTSRWANPRWSWTVSLPIMKDESTLAHWKVLVGFLMQMQGGADSFLFCPPESANTIGNRYKGAYCSLSGVQIGVGDGVQKVFPLVQPFGTQTYPYGKAAEPVQWLDDRNGAPTFRAGGSVVSATYRTWDGATGGELATFATAPGAGLAVTADFHFAYRVRVANDVSFDQLAWQMWEGAELELEQCFE